jgi:hypothetical protein
MLPSFLVRNIRKKRRVDLDTHLERALTLLQKSKLLNFIKKFLRVLMSTFRKNRKNIKEEGFVEVLSLQKIGIPPANRD